MADVRFEALEHRADGGFDSVTLRYTGSTASGWNIERNGQPALSLGPGYRLLRSIACGVCSTDLARRFLPFPLPQVIGHELVAVDENGARFAVEINASHRARGVADCAFCSAGLATHCPDRLVLGIHDLPGGFGPWILAPVEATIAIPDAVPTETATLIEPFAAALHAVTSVDPRPGERIAVLGPRRLGMLVLAALHGHARAHGIDLEILALTRRPDLLPLARRVGATSALVVDPKDPSENAHADVVIDTTGNPGGLDLALRLATREVHLKSTHGQEAAGLHHTTELVVDELTLARLDTAPFAGRVAWLASTPPPRESPDLVVEQAPQRLIAAADRCDPLGRFDAAVTDRGVQVDTVIRPTSERETALIRPRGEIFVLPSTEDSSPLLQAIARRGLRLSSSRCGDFRAALQRLGDPELRELGQHLVTHRFDATELAEAFRTAESRDCVKALVAQPHLR